jgi:hypothetical protein
LGWSHSRSTTASRIGMANVLGEYHLALGFPLDIELGGMPPWHRVGTDARLRTAGLDEKDD